VVSDFTTIQSDSLPPNTKTQLTELAALTRVLKLSKGKRINIYTNSKYAFPILHAHAALWKKQRMLTASGSPVKYSQEILALLDAVLIPEQVPIFIALAIKRELLLQPRETKPLMRLQKRPAMTRQSSFMGGIPDSPGEVPLPAGGSPIDINPR
jgi:hypothetical protein